VVLQVLDARLHVERDLLPEHRGLVVVEARVHGQDEEPAAREFVGRHMSQIVVDPMDQEDADFRPIAGVRPIKHRLDGEGIELDVGLATLRRRGLGAKQRDESSGRQRDAECRARVAANGAPRFAPQAGAPIACFLRDGVESRLP
jgi:hypothetical protein